MVLRDRLLRALSRACALTPLDSFLRAPALPPQTALGSLLRARALSTIRHKRDFPAEAHNSSAAPIYSGSGSISSGSRNLPKEAQSATGTGGGGRFRSGGSGRGYGVMVSTATLSALIASLLNREDVECQDDDKLPESIDWTERGAVTSVKNQYNCGSCYALSAAGSIESLHKIKTGILLDLSVQQILDCAPGCNGCYGGFIFMALHYAVSAGLCLESTYPRRPDNWHGYCRMYLHSMKPAVRIQAFSVTDTSEEGLMRAVATRPVAVVIQFAGDNEYFREYTGGIIEHRDLPTIFTDEGKHTVLIVGYGTDEATGIPFWKIKNSWGSDWGENGYFRIRRNAPELLGPGGIRAGPGYYPLYDDKDIQTRPKIRKTLLEDDVEKQIDVFDRIYY